MAYGQNAAVVPPTGEEEVTRVIKRDSRVVTGRRVEDRQTEKPGVLRNYANQDLSVLANAAASERDRIDLEIALNMDVLFRTP